MIKRHERRQLADLSRTSPSASSQPEPGKRICRCSLHPNGIPLSKSTVLRHLRRDRKKAAVSSSGGGDLSAEESLVRSEAEYSPDDTLSNSEPHQSFLRQPLIEIDADDTGYTDLPSNDNSFYSQVDMEIGSWDNNFGMGDESDLGGAEDIREDEAELEAQMKALVAEIRYEVV